MVETGEVRVWSRFVRVFHWTLVSSVAAAWITSELGRDWHEPVGWAVVVLLALRLLWGIVGPDRPARFSSFVRAPSAALDYARQAWCRSAPRYLGHNPLGGWMVLALMVALAAISLTGWLLTTEVFWGSEALEEVHDALAVGLLGLVALHVAGVVYTSRHQQENLARAMVSGRKRAAGPDDIPT
jgi:cytochrome b